MSESQGHVLYSRVIDLPLKNAWDRMRSFGSPPGLTGGSVEITNGKGETEIGAQRTITFAGGQQVRETLVDFDDTTTSFAYVINGVTEGFFPGSLHNYKAWVKFFPIIETDQTFAHWEAKWNGTNVSGTTAAVTGIFKSVLASIQ
eukprot:TRINITY_DN2922_c0_g2_i2.p1 TRINITY_DN2922_c0_g2~~TRINITY_DN2922_c0_g2_i2.p1  ORF type:complete len:165 (+),score=36.53 TRINITY_DN2922_c0_g2_i2:61-495(+)